MKIKKLIVLLLATIILVISCCISGCSNNATAQEDIDAEGNRFKILSYSKENLNVSEYILYDTETKVMYLLMQYDRGGGLTVMVDENGKPLLYEG